MSNSRILFLRKFFTEPQKIGSITPSTKYLARKMVEDIDWQNTDYIAELGAGTGIFTEYIDSHKKSDARFTIVEQDNKMLELLQQRYKGNDFARNAENLPFIAQKFAIRQYDHIISGLPFAVFDQELRQKILTGIVSSLKPGGTFTTFQYTLQMRSQLRANFSNVTITFEPRNFPPAFIYHCTK